MFKISLIIMYYFNSLLRVYHELRMSIKLQLFKMTYELIIHSSRIFFLYNKNIISVLCDMTIFKYL